MSKLKFRVIQTCVPEYRAPLFHLLSRVNDVEVFCGEDYFTDALSVIPGDVAWKRALKNRFFFFKRLLWQSGAVKLFRGDDIVVAEFNTRILSTWVLIALRRAAGRRTLLWGHLSGRYGRRGLPWMARLLMLRLSNGLICYSRIQREELRNIWKRFPSWAASNSCVNSASCVPVSYPSEGSCVTYVGRLIAAKKPHLLIEGFARAARYLPSDARLLMVGDGPERIRLEQLASVLGIAARVEFHGHVVDEIHLRAVYERTVVAVSPGYVGLSAIQCMAYGIPILLAKQEPHSPEIEACVERKTAMFFESDNADDLARHLPIFFRHGSSWSLARPAISEFIARNYTFEGMAKTFEEAISSVSFIAARLEKRRVGIAWAQFGPYHYARLDEVARQYGKDYVVGIEIAGKTTTYAWNTDGSSECRLTTLAPDAAVEVVSAFQIYHAARRCIKANEIEVMFVPSYWPPTSLAILFAAWTCGCRMVMMNDSHALTSKARGPFAWVKRRLVSSFDAGLVAGTPQKEYFAGLGMSASRIVLGYDVVDNDFFVREVSRIRKDASRYRDGVGLPLRYFLNVGRMVEKKNLEILIRAFADIRKAAPDSPSLVLVGSGESERDLHDLCSDLGLSSMKIPRNSSVRNPVADVLFFGFRQVNELPIFYAFADCFILPSRQEEWGLVVNEAMACELPVIVSEVAGCARDLVQSGVNGFTFPPDDSTRLAKYMTRIAQDGDLRDKMGSASRRIISHWGCDRFAAAVGDAAVIACR